MKNIEIINPASIYATLEKNKTSDASQVREIFTKARTLQGLTIDDVAHLITITDKTLIDELFETARYIKQTIYGRRLVVFAPMYISNLCANECLYCAFRARNKAIHRRVLSQAEIAEETRLIEKQGHKRILLVAGESYPKEGFQYVLDSIKTIYNTKNGSDEIRRVNVNVAPLPVEEFKELKATGIGTFQLFQETYDPEVYKRVHVAGQKTDYNWRVTGIDRAMEAGIDDVGIGVLFGLADWRFEMLALMQHIKHLENKFGVGPHTISVPRLEPATGSEMASNPPVPVNDIDFLKIIAILRLAVPYTGIIMSTRETPEIRRETLALGVSQISAGSHTNPGGYAENEDIPDQSQFSLGDHRTLDEIIVDISKDGYIPSFCTGCYRLGRTGNDFMDLAKPGLIRHHCDPNAVSTFQEFLDDYGSTQAKDAGKEIIKTVMDEMEEAPAKLTKEMLEKVKDGKRDVLC